MGGTVYPCCNGTKVGEDNEEKNESIAEKFSP